MLLKLSVSFALMFWAFVKEFDSNFHRNAMFAIIFGFIGFMMIGCTTITYKDQGAEFSKTTFGTQLQVAKFVVGRDPAGRITFDLEGYKSDQVQAIEATAKGVAEGLAQGAKP